MVDSIPVLQTVWPLIEMAPWDFATLFVIVTLTGWAVGRFMFTERLKNLESRIASRDEKIDEMRKQVDKIEVPAGPILVKANDDSNTDNKIVNSIHLSFANSYDETNLCRLSFAVTKSTSILRVYIEYTVNYLDTEDWSPTQKYMLSHAENPYSGQRFTIPLIRKDKNGSFRWGDGSGGENHSGYMAIQKHKTRIVFEANGENQYYYIMIITPPLNKERQVPVIVSQDDPSIPKPWN